MAFLLPERYQGGLFAKRCWSPTIWISLKQPLQVLNKLTTNGKFKGGSGSNMVKPKKHDFFLQSFLLLLSHESISKQSSTWTPFCWRKDLSSRVFMPQGNKFQTSNIILGVFSANEAPYKSTNSRGSLSAKTRVRCLRNSPPVGC